MNIQRMFSVLALVSVAACGLNSSPGESNKIGQITSIHRVGIFCTTWEAQLQRGGFQNGSGVTGAPFEFTVENDSLAKQVRSLMEANTEVEITYHTEGLYSSCRSESGGNFLVSIRALHDSTVAHTPKT
jgi:hypothetical protein